MKTMIVYVIHGRKSGSTLELVSAIRKAGACVDFPQCIVYLKGTEDPLETALQRAGARHLVIVPLLLYPAGHFCAELPRRIKAALPQGATFEILPPLGKSRALANYLQQKFAAAQRKFPSRTFLLVNHGSSQFAGPQNELQQLADQLSGALAVPVAAVGLHPAPLLPQCLAGHTAPLLIQPIFLTNGRLVQTLSQTVKAIRPNDRLLSPLADSGVLAAMISERLEGCACIR
ncbi:MAG: hypothetical protein LKJ03_05175 [Enterococcaceae bacterium]|jgi:sirohydrochlorin ferrochelatase|nr:hypothetical protein [Enterococcaceae bacterium]MCI1919576.1 hypothetical protein [Enterococcaceae bacterium]